MVSVSLLQRTLDHKIIRLFEIYESFKSIRREYINLIMVNHYLNGDLRFLKPNFFYYSCPRVRKFEP